ncbi:hypothetical protein [Neolewinella agarilytica]|uniref:hypothetical protein n=1 Tax=Neolewinella agarilytica TaxID=478744 RepID=UPI00235482A9|nr:hypothetical protein [Neolewinella agarilytica]
MSGIINKVKLLMLVSLLYFLAEVLTFPIRAKIAVLFLDANSYMIRPFSIQGVRIMFVSAIYGALLFGPFFWFVALIFKIRSSSYFKIFIFFFAHFTCVTLYQSGRVIRNYGVFSYEFIFERLFQRMWPMLIVYVAFVLLYRLFGLGKRPSVKNEELAILDDDLLGRG